MADRYLIETSPTDGYQLEDASGVLLLETGGPAAEDPPFGDPISRIRKALAAIPPEAWARSAHSSRGEDTAETVVQEFIPSRGGWVNVVARSWHQPPPQPQQRRPGRIVSVDDPPAYSIADYMASRGWWNPPPPPPQRQIPKQIISVDDPPPWSFAHEYTARGTWEPGPPTPWQIPPRQIVSVDQPQPLNNGWLEAVLLSWRPPDPLPQQRGPFYPQEYVPPSDAVPLSRGWLNAAVASWIQPFQYPPSRAPYPQEYVAPSESVPLSRTWLPAVIASWTQPFQYPQTREPFPQESVVPGARPWLSAALASWTPPLQYQQARVEFPQAAVTPDEPTPLSRGWLNAALQAWIPPFQYPPSRTLLPQELVTADNPPFPGPNQRHVLRAWWDPRAPDPWRIPPRQVTPGPEPVPPEPVPPQITGFAWNGIYYPGERRPWWYRDLKDKARELERLRRERIARGILPPEEQERIAETIEAIEEFAQERPADTLDNVRYYTAMYDALALRVENLVDDLIEQEEEEAVLRAIHRLWN